MAEENILDNARAEQAGLPALPRDFGRLVEMLQGVANRAKSAPVASGLWKLKDWLGSEIERLFPGSKIPDSSMPGDGSWVDAKSVGDVYTPAETAERLSGTGYGFGDWRDASDVMEHQAGNRRASTRMYLRNKDVLDENFNRMAKYWGKYGEESHGNQFANFVKSMGKLDLGRPIDGVLPYLLKKANFENMHRYDMRIGENTLNKLSNESFAHTTRDIDGNVRSKGNDLGIDDIVAPQDVDYRALNMRELVELMRQNIGKDDLLKTFDASRKFIEENNPINDRIASDVGRLLGNVPSAILSRYRRLVDQLPPQLREQILTELRERRRK